MISHGNDYQVLKNLSMLGDSSANVPRADKIELIRSKIDANFLKAYERNKHSYDLRAKPRTFDVGQIVIKRNFALSNAAANFNAKLAPVGTKVRIKEKIGNTLYLVEDLSGKELGQFHAKDLWI